MSAHRKPLRKDFPVNLRRDQARLDQALRDLADEAASRERSAQVMDLAQQIADREVRTVVEAYCDDGEVDNNDVVWMNTHTSGNGAEEKGSIDRAVRYIDLREPGAFPWRFIRHPDQPHLVRFEDTP